MKSPIDHNNNQLLTPCFQHEQSATSLFSIISEAKPAEIIVNECGEVELQMTKENHKYYMAYELIFHVNNRDNHGCTSFSEYSLSENPKNISDKLCCFAETKNGSLLLATDQGTIGIIDVAKSLTIWVSIMRPYYDNNSASNPLDNLYDDGSKVLIDICIDKKNDQIIVLTKFIKTENNVPEFRVEVYIFCEDKNEMNLLRIFNLSQSLASHLGNNETFDFVRIYFDQLDNSYVVLDANNHKLYWCNTFNFQAKRCVKSADGESIKHPSGIAMIEDPKTLYVCSQKGMLIRKLDQQPVKHDSLKPIDISYSKEDKAIYFIDEFNLYRSKITDTIATEQRFKRIFSNKCQNKRFKRVCSSQNYVFIMSKEINSLFVIDRKSLKF